MHNFISPAVTDVVIYHDNCVDGFASAWAAYRFLAPNTIYLPCSYGQIPELPNTINDHSNIYIVDFSFSRQILKVFAALAKHVVVLDHHKTAQEALENWEDKPENVEIVFDMNRSGAGITWDWFNQNWYDTPKTNLALAGNRPSFINYVEDRDLWRFALPSSKEVNAYISHVPKTFEAYDDFDYTTFEDMSVSGKLLLDQHQKFCEEIVLDARDVIINDKAGLACNCTPQFSSEVGNLLTKKSGTYGATYHSTRDGSVKWSLRSEGDYDVSAIAKQFGGGGHKNASGFSLTPNETDRSDCIKLWNIGEQV